MDTAFPARRHDGFTLIELMIAVTIIAILGAVAIPSYRDYLRRGSIEEAAATLSTGRVTLEQYYLDNRTYVGGTCPSATTSFTFTCTLNATSYKLTATGSRLVTGFTYTLDSADARTTASPWGNGNCWIMRRSDSC